MQLFEKLGLSEIAPGSHLVRLLLLIVHCFATNRCLRNLSLQRVLLKGTPLPSHRCKL